jgi:uncharacterized protein YbjQ (UPF0145 family)
VTVGGWDGRGLPPVAGARIRRARPSGVRTSLLSASGLAGLEVAGFEPVGEVLGAAVVQTSWTYFHGCGYVLTGSRLSGRAATAGRWVDYYPYTQAVRSGWDKALDRMRLEAAGLGADGVVGVRLTDEPLEGEKREFLALGTAVRSRGRERTDRPFTTDLGAPDVVKLLGAGWAPAGIVCAFFLAVTHDDWRVGLQTSRFVGNTEVTGYTELVNHVRAGARAEFETRTGRLEADGALMSDIRLHVRALETGNNHRDHAAECLIVGNAVARYRKPVAADLPVSTVILSDRGMPRWRPRGMTEQ